MKGIDDNKLIRFLRIHNGRGINEILEEFECSKRTLEAVLSRLTRNGLIYSYTGRHYSMAERVRSNASRDRKAAEMIVRGVL